MELLQFNVAWGSLLAWLNVLPEDARPLRTLVLSQYREPGRAYHTLRHALRVLNDTKDYARRWGVEDYGAVQLAALLHDVVYDPHRPDNEARSAELVLEWGALLGVAPATRERAAEIVLATRDHVCPDNMDFCCVMDADLAILCASWAEYDIYRRAIRREYSWVAEPEWIAGRGRVLSTFLQRERIYHTPHRHAEREKAARANIAHELSLL